MLDATEWMLLIYILVIVFIAIGVYLTRDHTLKRLKRNTIDDLERTKQFVLSYIEKPEDIEAVKSSFDKHITYIRKMNSTDEVISRRSLNITDIKIYDYIPSDNINKFTIDYIEHLNHKLVRIKERT